MDVILIAPTAVHLLALIAPAAVHVPALDLVLFAALVWAVHAVSHTDLVTVICGFDRTQLLLLGSGVDVYVGRHTCSELSHLHLVHEFVFCAGSFDVLRLNLI